jgi:AcrR family transcriptional regulator
LVQKSDARPRGRPRGFDTADVLKAASERFRTHGFAGTSLDDLVDATGLARPSLYAAFGDKRAIYLAVLKRTYERSALGFDRLIAQDLPLRDSLETLLTVIIDGYMSGETGPSGCIAISTASTSAVDDPEIRAWLESFLKMEDDKVTELLVSRDDPQAQTHAHIIAAVIHSLSVRARAGAPREELDALASDCVNLIAPHQG